MLGLAGPAGAGNTLSPKALKTLEKTLQSGSGQTYLATYNWVSNGSNETVTIAQSPPKSNISSSSGSFINTGTKSYVCTGSSSSASCYSSGSTNPLSALINVFSSKTALNALSQAQHGLLSRILGYKTTSSNQTIGGQPSTCISISVRSKSAKYCVTKSGLLSYSGTSSGYFELTNLSSSPPASLFALPAGATVVTLPGGTSIP